MINRILGKILLRADRIKRAYLTSVINSSINNLGGVIGEGTVVVCPSNITIGEKSYINGGFIKASPNARIIIGDNCLISYGVHMRTDMHNYIDKNTPINEQGMLEKDIVIGNDVWIGYGVQILAGVHVANGCVIGAGAVVTKDTEPYGVYVGVPAKMIKMRQ